MSQLGNLDSKNSLEIMNIIKSISKEKLEFQDWPEPIGTWCILKEEKV